MLSEGITAFFTVWANVAIIVTLVLYLAFVVLYGNFYRWRETRAGRSVYLTFLSILLVSAVSFLTVWFGEDYWARPFLRAAAWTAAVSAAIYLLYALLRRWQTGRGPSERIVIEPKTDSIPLSEGGTHG